MVQQMARGSVKALNEGLVGSGSGSTGQRRCSRHHNSETLPNPNTTQPNMLDDVIASSGSLAHDDLIFFSGIACLPNLGRIRDSWNLQQVLLLVLFLLRLPLILFL